MGQKLVEKIISSKVGRKVEPGEIVVTGVDFVALHDRSGPR